jgi:RimJ/RimL family protein N-acetyltransferase
MHSAFCILHCERLLDKLKFEDRRTLMMHTIRRAATTDLPRILEIYARARRFMAETGNPNQWGKTNPPREMLENDISRELLRVVEENSKIHGVFFFSMEEDPTYSDIYDGKWESDDLYGTIHRIASDGSGGIFTAALDWCLAQCKHLRIDTHHDNKVMQHVVEKHGFSRRGIIYIADGSPRIAYERL